MTRCTRRHFLATLGLGLAGTLLSACGQSATPTPPTPIPVRAGPPATPGTPGVGRVAASPIAATPMATLTATVPPPPSEAPDFARDCVPHNYQGAPQPSDPYSSWLFSEGAASSFEKSVRSYADLIVLVEQGIALPPRWTTPDGNRPGNPHTAGYTIITPARASVVAVVKGRYDLPVIYTASFGGAIGQDCVGSSNSVSLADGPAGPQTLALLKLSPYTELSPVPEDPRYRFYQYWRGYPVSLAGTITIGPERDIMGYHYDDPPRTVTVDAALAEIAAILGTPAR